MNKAESTRLYILEKAFQIIYANGYNGTSIDRIIETTNVTKGAFFYHFKNKEEMGLAVIDEIIYPRFSASLIEPLYVKGIANPLDRIYETIRSFLDNISDEELKNGCPTNNLIQEMAPVNEKFRRALLKILDKWKERLIATLLESVSTGRIKSTDLESSADFIIAAYEGARGLGKLHQSRSYYESYLKEVKRYLNNL